VPFNTRWSQPARLIGICAACVATAGAAAIGDGNVAVGLLPALSVAIMLGLWSTPLRYVLFAMLFLALALDSPGDSAGFWHSPAAPFGRLLFENLNKTIPVPALKISIFVVFAGLLVLASWFRRAPSAQLSTGALARPLRGAFVISGLTVVISAVHGIGAGGDIQMINMQVQPFLMTLIMGYVLATSVVTERDVVQLGRVVIAAACVKATMAVWVRQVVGLSYERVTYATTHGDSLSFVTAAALLVAAVIGGQIRRTWLAIGLLMVILAGIQANNRRIAWMELFAIIGTLYWIWPASRGKRRLTRAALAISPILLVYIGIGWNSSASIFAPVHVFRSVEDGDIDRSTLYRDLEDFNLVATFNDAPLIGSGLGRPFKQVIKLDDISKAFPQWEFMPHNSILWLLSATGVFGFIGIWATPITVLLLAARSYWRPVSAADRVAAFVVIATVEAYVIQCWGDMGFSENKAMILIAITLAVTNRLFIVNQRTTPRTLAIAA
jgi:hypothetical protein